jgi:hypothetical protein
MGPEMSPGSMDGSKMRVRGGISSKKEITSNFISKNTRIYIVIPFL